MENTFYQRATGKLSKTTHNSYTPLQHSRRDSSTIYSLEDNEEDYLQYPLGVLSRSQKKYIEAFVHSATGNNLIQIDDSTKGIHWLGMWKLKDQSITVSCSFSQPNITNATTHLSRMSFSTASMHAETYFPNKSVSIIKNIVNCQPMGKYAIPFVDKLIDEKIIREELVSFSNILLGRTQLIFCIVTNAGTFECTLSHISCEIMADCTSHIANITYPTTGTYNFEFRSPDILDGRGSGPHISVHSLGMIQYQGKPHRIGEVVGVFRECILFVMGSLYSTKFLRSLSITREV